MRNIWTQISRFVSWVTQDRATTFVGNPELDALLSPTAKLAEAERRIIKLEDEITNRNKAVNNLEGHMQHLREELREARGQRDELTEALDKTTAALDETHAKLQDCRDTAAYILETYPIKASVRNLVRRIAGKASF